MSSVSSIIHEPPRRYDALSRLFRAARPRHRQIAARPARIGTFPDAARERPAPGGVSIGRSGHSAEEHDMTRKQRDGARGILSEDVLDNPGVVPIENAGVGQGWEVAERSRPDLPDETADGLDALQESVRHMAEDIPLAPLDDDAPALPFVGDSEPVAESIDAVENEGDVPGLTDQGADGDPPARGRSRPAKR
jgi:hypothetical protein